jgi:hypothetical protein
VLPTALGTVGLTAVIATLPILGDGEEVSLAEHVLAFVLVVLPVGVLLYGLIALVAGRPVPKLLLWGVAAGTFGVAAAYLGGRPEEVAAGPTALPLALVLLADVFRMAAAVCLGVVLARPFTSPGMSLLLTGVVGAVDLFSVFAGPTRALVEGRSPSLNYFLLGFPTFGRPWGFALGASDFLILAFFTALAERLDLRPLTSLALGCVGVALSLLSALLLSRPLPVAPFIALSLVLANASPLACALARKG